MNDLTLTLTLSFITHHLRLVAEQLNNKAIQNRKQVQIKIEIMIIVC